MAQPETPDEARSQAEHHFKLVLRSSLLFQLSEEQAAEQVRLSRLVVEAALQVPAGALIDFSGLMEREAATADGPRLLVRGMPFISGSLGLLDMEFAHETAGVIPPEKVRGLLAEPSGVEYQGVHLTPQNVFIQYRRRPWPGVARVPG